jgi:hypothetical protein
MRSTPLAMDGASDVGRRFVEQVVCAAARGRQKNGYENRRAELVQFTPDPGYRVHARKKN